MRNKLRSLSKIQFYAISLAIAGILGISAYFGYQAYVFSQISLDEALEAYEAEDYERAATLLERVASRKEMPPSGWFALADSQDRIGQYDRALLAYFKVEDAKYNLPETLFRMSVIYANLGATTRAIVWYQKALLAGFDDVERLEAQPELQQILDSEQAEEITIFSDQAVKSIDFILGEWSVRGSNRTSVPYVSIALSENGRVITERQASRSEILAVVTYRLQPSTGTWIVEGDYGDQGSFEGTMRWHGQNLKVSGTVIDGEGNSFPRVRYLSPEAGGRFRSTVYEGEDEQSERLVEYVFTPRTSGNVGLAL